MTWSLIIIIILISIFILVITCLPTGVVEWILSKFELHSKLESENVTVSINGNSIEGNQKTQIIDSFNEATFLEKYSIQPGTEELYLNPEDSGSPVIIDAKEGKRDVKIFLFHYRNHVNVVKQYKTKVVSYSLLSEDLLSGNDK